jgi:hypothetical protein
MSGRSRTGKTRANGHLETLPSGALRVSVYAGRDAVSGTFPRLCEAYQRSPKVAADTRIPSLSSP